MSYLLLSLKFVSSRGTHSPLQAMLPHRQRCLLSYVDDEGLVAQLQELDHAVLVEGDATGGIGLVALAVDEDGRTLLIDALAVVTGGHPIIVLGHVGVHVLAVALVVHDGGVDDLVVVVAVAAGKGRRCDIDVIELGAGVGADAECLAHVQCAGGCLAVAFALLADAILADEDVGDKDFFAVDGEPCFGLASLDVIDFEQLAAGLGDGVGG